MERRIHPRYKYITPMQVTVAKKLFKGYTYDIGQGGVSFIIDTVIHPGAVKIELPEANLTLEGRIITNQPTDTAGLYRHQMQFKELLLNMVLEELLG